MYEEVYNNILNTCRNLPFRKFKNESIVVKLLLKEAPKAIDVSDSENFQIKLDSIECKIHDIIITLL